MVDSGFVVYQRVGIADLTMKKVVEGMEELVFKARREREGGATLTSFAHILSTV